MNSRQQYTAMMSEGRIAMLEAQVRALNETVQRLLRQGGLSKLLTEDLSRHPVQDLTSAPTETVAGGSLRTVKTGGLYYLYAYIDGAWRRVQVT